MLSLNWCRTCWNCSRAEPSTRRPGRSRMRRFALCTLLCGVLLAQQSSRPPDPQNDDDQYRISVRVEEVVAPTLVFDRDGYYVNGLTGNQFHLFDNGKEQNINVDFSFIPISLVIAVQEIGRAS